MPIHAKLEREKVADHTWTFNLILSGDAEKTFYLARIKNGGMTLVNYEISRNRNGHDILSAFFYVNIMGHDLDQWIHFDLTTGEQIPNAADIRPVVKMQSRQASQEDKHRAAKKLRLIVEKWGREKNIDSGENSLE